MKYTRKYTSFIKEIKAEIEKMEEDVSCFKPTLSDCVRGLEELPGQLRRWGRLLSKIERYKEYLQIEYDEWEASEMARIRQEMVADHDKRKTDKKPTIPFTETAITEKFKKNPERSKYLLQIASLRYYSTYVERNCYWATKNSNDNLGHLSRFAVVNERKDR